MRSLRSILLLAVVALHLFGCAVKPSPFTDKENASRLVADKSLLFKDQEHLHGPLTLAEAVARALAYNFDNRMAMFEAALQDKQLDVANVSMLPRLAANAGFSVRSNELASSSVSYQTRQTTLEASVSQQQARFTPDLSLSWSILDFGISYFQAKQQADRYLVAKERRRRVVSNIVREVVGVWWKASTAQRLLPLIEPAAVEAEAGLALLQRQAQDPLMPVLNSLELQKSLLQTISQLRRIQSDLSLAKTQLAALANLPPSSEFTLAEPPASAWKLPVVREKIEDLETLGLFFRPDLHEEMYQERIDRSNVWKVLISYLPGVSQASSLNYDSNIFLVNNFWAEIGVRFTASLMSLVQGPKAYQAAKAQLEVDKVRRLALTMAALVQINISRLEYLRAVRSYQDAAALTDVEEKILKVVTDGVNARAEPELERVRREATTIVATYDRDQDLAVAYRALGSLYFSVGADMLPLDGVSADLAGLTAQVEEHLTQWQSGVFPSLPEQAGLNPSGRSEPVGEGKQTKSSATSTPAPTAKDTAVGAAPLRETSLNPAASSVSPVKPASIADAPNQPRQDVAPEQSASPVSPEPPVAAVDAKPDTASTGQLSQGRRSVQFDQVEKQAAAKPAEPVRKDDQPKAASVGVGRPPKSPEAATAAPEASGPDDVAKIEIMVIRRPVPLDQAAKPEDPKPTGQNSTAGRSGIHPGGSPAQPSKVATPGADSSRVEPKTIAPLRPSSVSEAPSSQVPARSETAIP